MLCLLAPVSVLYHSLLSHLCYLYKYSAPEVINRKPYDQKVDMWSIGVTCYLLLCGDTPFNGKNRQQLFRRISCDEPTFPDDKWGHISDEAVEFVRKLLTKDPAKRLSAAQALQHRWLTETNSMMAQQEQPVMNSFVSEAESSEERGTARSSDLRASGSAKSPGGRVNSNHSNEKQLKPSRSKSNSNRSISRDRIKNRSITRDARTKSRSASQERRKARTKTPPPPPKPQATSPRENSSKKLSANNNSGEKQASSHSASDENAKLLDVIKNQDAKIERLEAMVKRMLEPEAAVHEC